MKSVLQCNLWYLWSYSYSAVVDTSKGETTKQLVFPLSRTYMDDITLLVQSKIGAENLLWCCHSLFILSRMKIKLVENQSLSIFKDSVKNTHFHIGDDIIMIIKEKSIKSLGRLYEVPLTDHHQGTEVQKVALKSLPGKLTTCCYQHGLLTHLLWPLQRYEIVPLQREWIQ